MRWTPGGVSSDVEDRRDESGGGGGFSFGGGGFGGRHIGIGGALLLLILSFVFKTNLFSLFFGGADGSVASVPARSSGPRPGEDKQVQFVSWVLDDVQNTWDKLLPAQKQTAYRHSKLVLFRDYTESACGTAESAVGPFYCSPDQKVYIDLSFFDELKNRFGAPGEFAEAYVIAHEVGHHVQDLLGIQRRLRRLQDRDPSSANPLSVELELQADCFAGIWGNSTSQRDIIDRGDVAQALAAASAIGDDRLQKMSTGHVVPESFTHGSSQQRMHWFKTGLDTGQISACDTSAR